MMLMLNLRILKESAFTKLYDFPFVAAVLFASCCTRINPLYYLINPNEFTSSYRKRI